MEKFLNIVKNITGEQIALISIFVTFFIYSLGKQNELKMKKHEAKKEQYMKFIKLFEKTFNLPEKNINKSYIKDDFFDTGASLLLYGSRKLYKQYVFFREFSSNPLIKQCKYYDDGLAMFILSDIFITIRKEVGLNSFNNISSTESLAFFVNSIANNPNSVVESYKAKFKILMIKVELFFYNIYKLVFVKHLFYIFIMPCIGVIRIIFKVFIMIPVGKIILKINPDANKNTKQT